MSVCVRTRHQTTKYGIIQFDICTRAATMATCFISFLCKLHIIWYRNQFFFVFALAPGEVIFGFIWINQFPYDLALNVCRCVCARSSFKLQSSFMLPLSPALHWVGISIEYIDFIQKDGSNRKTCCTSDLSKTIVSVYIEINDMYTQTRSNKYYLHFTLCSCVCVCVRVWMCAIRVCISKYIQITFARWLYFNENHAIQWKTICK